MLKRIKSVFLSVVFTLSVLISALPIDAVALTADQTVTPALPTKAVTLADVAAGVATIEDLYGALDAATVPEIVGYQAALSRNHVRRLYEEEGNDLYKLVFLNADGTHTMYLYDYPVKYLDSAGKARDITLDIADDAVSSGGFQTAANAVTTTFAKDMSDGISLSAKNATLSLVPHARENRSSATLQASSVATARRVNSKTVAYTYDEKTNIEYSLTYTGFKEDIVVSAYTGQTEYDFTLYTNGLRLVEKDGSFSLVDADGVAQAFLGDIIIFTADEKNNAFGRMTAQTVTECQEYVLTIHVDAAYLADSKTVYPIRIDPTVEINYDNNGNGAISDVTISSNAGSSATSGALYVGLRENYGISRILMKFPGLNLSSLGNYLTINSATVELRDILCESQELGISCYVFNGSAWNETTVNWANASPNSYTVFLSEREVSYANGLQQTPSHRYSFDITKAVQGWETGIYNPNKGIIFKAWNTLENGTAYANKTFASYNRASNKPSLSVTYTVIPAPTIEDDVYYVNNKGSGDYLRAITTESMAILTAQSGSVAQLGYWAQWDIRFLGDGEYVIRMSTDRVRYLKSTGLQTDGVALGFVDGTQIPEVCRWKISLASGGCIIQNVANSRYLYCDGGLLFTSETLGSMGTETYYQKIWRVMPIQNYGYTNIFDYRELEGFSIDTLQFAPQQMALPQITSELSNVVWADPSDFTYTFLNSTTVNESMGVFSANTSQIVSVRAKHKVTDRESNIFAVVVDSNIPTLTIKSYVDIGYKIRWGNDIQEITDYHQKVAEILKQLFGLTVTFTIEETVSPADFCKIMQFGEFTFEHLDDPCTHSACHLDRHEMVDDLDGHDTFTEILWTGHVNGDDHRSWSFSSRNAILMTPHSAEEPDYDNQSETEIYQAYVCVLLHEISHQLGAPDHYCYNKYEDETATPPCENDNCDVCVHDKEERLCEMTDSSRWASVSLDKVYCEECFEIISDHLLDHH